MDVATFGAGCFWGVEVAFRNLDGVTDTAVGYMGGSTERPSYEDVCSDATGHAEVVQVSFDPQRVRYGALLELFWQLHDPTQLNRQGPDVGTQYRGAIFTHSEEQRVEAEASREAQRGRHRRPVVTSIEPAATFWPAEEYHQQYLVKRGLASCRI